MTELNLLNLYIHFTITYSFYDFGLEFICKLEFSLSYFADDQLGEQFGTLILKKIKNLSLTFNLRFKLKLLDVEHSICVRDKRGFDPKLRFISSFNY